MESVSSGGSQEDNFPTALNPFGDYMVARGILPQSATPAVPGVADELVGIERDSSGNMILWDDVLGTRTLTQLAASSSGITPAEHEVIRQLIHFIGNGPAEGFASGAYREVVTPGAFPDGYIWWESSSKLKKIVEVTLTWVGARVTVEQWEIYDTDGSTVLATATDAISYTGLNETSRTRTIA